MKASTLFVISIAVLIGLGTIGVAKYVGLFKSSTPIAPVKEEPVLVLVANSDLYAGVAVTPSQVRIRELRPDERGFYEQNRTVMMPGSVAAVNMRVPTSPIRADSPLTRSMFEDKPPERVSDRLEKGMRAVNVAVTKENSAGGVIQLGEHVDVWLTSRVNDPLSGVPHLKTARLDRDCKVIMKRNNLSQIMAADGGTIPFTLQVNPYRAALIEWAKQKGVLSLQPVPTPKMMQETGAITDDTPMKSHTDTKSAEYKDEDFRIDQVNRGEYVVGDQDLDRIFKVRPPTPPTTVLEIVGINPRGYVYFGDPRAAAGSNLPTYVPVGGRSAGASNFQDPSSNPDCPGCEERKRKSAEGAPK